MKFKTFLFVATIFSFAAISNAQIKVHSSGGISIGSETDPESGNTLIDDNLEVTGTTQFDNDVDFDGDIDANANLVLDGTGTLNGDLTLKSDFTIQNSSSTVILDVSTTTGSEKTIFSMPVEFSEIGSNILPSSSTLNLGSSSDDWRKIYCVDMYASNLTLTGYNMNVKSDLVPYTDNTYSLGREAIDQGGPHWWKDVFSYNLTSETLTLNELDIDVNYSSQYGATGITFDFGQGNLFISSGPTTYIDFMTTKSYYNFDEELRVQGTYIYSDINLKKDVKEIKKTGPSIDKLKQLNGITYKLKEDKDNLEYAGFSAQEIQNILPHLVFEDEDGVLSVNYTGLIPYLVEALKEQEARIKQLESLIR